MLIGAHVSTAGGISKAVARGTEIGCEALQIFGSSPQGWAFKPIPGTEIESFRQQAAESSIGSVNPLPPMPCYLMDQPTLERPMPLTWRTGPFYPKAGMGRHP